MDRVKVPTTLHLDYDLTWVIAYGTAAAILLVGFALLLGVVLGIVIVGRVERKMEQGR